MAPGALYRISIKGSRSNGSEPAAGVARNLVRKRWIKARTSRAYPNFGRSVRMADRRPGPPIGPSRKVDDERRRQREEDDRRRRDDQDRRRREDQEKCVCALAGLSSAFPTSFPQQGLVTRIATVMSICYVAQWAFRNEVSANSWNTGRFLPAPGRTCAKLG